MPESEAEFLAFEKRVWLRGGWLGRWVSGCVFLRCPPSSTTTANNNKTSKNLSMSNKWRDKIENLGLQEMK
jgi:hypothetical protein